MKISHFLVLAILFPITSWATQDYVLNVKHILIEGVNDERLEIVTSANGSVIERIDANLPIGKFSIPSNYLVDAKNPDLTSVSVMYNPGGGKIEADKDGNSKGIRWKPYYVVRFYFYGDGSEQYIVEGSAPELEVVFRDSDEPQINLIKNYECPPPHMTDFGCSSRTSIKVSGTRVHEK